MIMTDTEAEFPWYRVVRAGLGGAVARDPGAAWDSFYRAGRREYGYQEWHHGTARNAHNAVLVGATTRRAATTRTSAKYPAESAAATGHASGCDRVPELEEGGPVTLFEVHASKIGRIAMTRILAVLFFGCLHAQAFASSAHEYKCDRYKESIDRLESYISADLTPSSFERENFVNEESKLDRVRNVAIASRKIEGIPVDKTSLSVAESLVKGMSAVENTMRNAFASLEADQETMKILMLSTVSELALDTRFQEELDKIKNAIVNSHKMHSVVTNSALLAQLRIKIAYERALYSTICRKNG